VIDANNADDLRHALIVTLRRQVEIAHAMVDEVMAALGGTGSAYMAISNLFELAVTLSNEAFDTVDEITFPPDEPAAQRQEEPPENAP